MLYFYVPPSTLPASFFGIYAGTVDILGLHLEHEWFGFGLMIAGIVLLWKREGVMLPLGIVLLLAGAALFISDFSGVIGVPGEPASLVVNLDGSLVSMGIAEIVAFALLRLVE